MESSPLYFILLLHDIFTNAYLPLVAARVASSREDAKSSTYRVPIDCRSRCIAVCASSFDANSTNATPDGRPSIDVTM